MEVKKDMVTLTPKEIAHPYAVKRRLKFALDALEHTDIEDFVTMFSIDEDIKEEKKKDAEREKSEKKEKLKAINKIIYEKNKIAAQKRKKNPVKKRKLEHADLNLMFL
jgi:hypothetical protein